MPEDKWEKPAFKGLTLLGPWRECQAMFRAEQRGSTVVDEAGLCAEMALQPEAVEQWLADHWIEHDIHAVTEGKETCADKTLSIVRDHDGVRWDPLEDEPLAEGVRPRHFQVRLFSPKDTADSALFDRLQHMRVRLM